MNEITAICQECNKQFEYVLKPGFPRKYCFECGAVKKESFEAKQNGDEPVEVVKPGEYDVKVPKPYEKDPVGLAVDVFCAMSDAMARQPDPDERRRPTTDEVMGIAINLVKQAREAFE